MVTASASKATTILTACTARVEFLAGALLPAVPFVPPCGTLSVALCAESRASACITRLRATYPPSALLALGPPCVRWATAPPSSSVHLLGPWLATVVTGRYAESRDWTCAARPRATLLPATLRAAARLTLLGAFVPPTVRPPPVPCTYGFPSLITFAAVRSFSPGIHFTPNFSFLLAAALLPSPWDLFSLFLRSGVNLEGNRGAWGKSLKRTPHSVRYRFHNVRGLGNEAFRRSYLERAQSTTDVLLLCETGCRSATEARAWDAAWRCPAFTAHAPYAPPPGVSGHTGRGLSLWVSSGVPSSEHALLHADPGGRALVVRMRVHGRDTLLIGFHADSATDREQAASYERLYQALASLFPDPSAPSKINLPDGVHVILLSDCNNTLHPAVDTWRPDSPPFQHRPAGAAALNTLMRSLGLADAFRAMHPESDEFTFRHHSGSLHRSDRALISSSLLPPVASASRISASSFEHLSPYHADLFVAIQGRDAPPSDHAGLRLCIRYSQLKAAHRRWRLSPSYLHNPETWTHLRALVDKAVSSSGPAASRLTSLVAEIKAWEVGYRRQTKSDFYRSHNVLLRTISNCQVQLGESLSSPPPPPDPRLPPSAHAARDAVLRGALNSARAKLSELHLSRQTLRLQTLDARALDADETCEREFFSTVRKAQLRAPTTQLRDSRGQKQRTPEAMLHTATKYYTGVGGVFNLPQDSSCPTHRAQRSRLLQALTDDNRHLSAAASQALTPECIFTVENITSAISSLPSGTLPGIDGIPNEFWRKFASKPAPADDPDEPPLPNPLALLVQEAFLDSCSSGGLFGDLNTSLVSLIHKGTGALDCLDNFRPIAVLCSLYRIFTRTVASCLGRHIHEVVGSEQHGFRPGKLPGNISLLVQELCLHCDQEKSSGVFISMDQSKAYDRVNWGFLREVLLTLGFDPSFANLISMLYDNNSIRFNLNGHLGPHASAKNGVRQGCPLSPLLYLMSIQPLLSLLRTHPDAPRGITHTLSSRRVTTLGFAYADDVGVALHSTAELPALDAIIGIFTCGSFGVINWKKTFGLLLGPGRDGPPVFPPGWDPSRVDFSKSALRLLGIMVGSPDHATLFAALQNKVATRFDLWSSRRLPSTIAGKNLVIKSSCVSCIWYALSHTFVPSASDAIIEACADYAWRFFDSSPSSLASGRLLHSLVSRATLVHNYPDFGARALDVPVFAASLRATWLYRAMRTPMELYKHYLLSYLNSAYGVFRQDFRILASNCDFLALGPHPFWCSALRLLGDLPSVVAVSPPPTPLTVLEILLEPLAYNPHLSGAYGARAPPDGPDPRRHLRGHGRLTPPPSADRTSHAKEMYAFFSCLALRGITHVIHLFPELTRPFPPGHATPISISPSPHRSLRALETLRLRFPPPTRPFAPAAFPNRYFLSNMVDALPLAWRTLIQSLSVTCCSPRDLYLALLNASPSTPWLADRSLSFAVAPASTPVPRFIQPTHSISPLGHIRPLPFPPPPIDVALLAPLAVWDGQSYPTAAPAILARENAIARGEPDPFPPLLRSPGLLADTCLIIPDLPPSPPSFPPLHRVSLPFPVTNSARPPVPLARLQLTHLYFIRLAQSYSPPRALLPPDHVPSASSTYWSSDIAHLAASVPATDHSVMSLLAGLLHGPFMTVAARDTLFRVMHDAYHVGSRGGAAHAHCFLCSRLLNRRVPETLRHLLVDCPFSAPVWTAIHRSALPLLCPPLAVPDGTQELSRDFALRVLFGFTGRVHGSPASFPQCGVCPVISACTHRALLERRQHHRSHPSDPRPDPARAVSRVHHLLKLTARATFTRARREEDVIYTTYNTWVPDPSPTQSWISAWSPLIPSAPAGCLSGLPALALPSYERSEGDPLPPFSAPPPAAATPP